MILLKKNLPRVVVVSVVSVVSVVVFIASSLPSRNVP
jgi:hypothetical protein